MIAVAAVTAEVPLLKQIRSSVLELQAGLEIVVGNLLPGVYISDGDKISALDLLIPEYLGVWLTVVVDLGQPREYSITEGIDLVNITNSATEIVREVL